MTPLLVGQRRAVDEQGRLRDLADGADHRLEALRRRGPTEREQPQRDRRGCAPMHGKSARSIPCPMGTSFALGSGNEPRSTETTVVETRSASRSRPLDAPVREPEQDPGPERPRERRREDGVDRAHVRQDGSRPRLPRELSRQGRLEAHATTHLRARPEQPHAGVAGKRRRRPPSRPARPARRRAPRARAAWRRSRPAPGWPDRPAG